MCPGSPEESRSARAGSQSGRGADTRAGAGTGADAARVQVRRAFGAAVAPVRTPGAAGRGAASWAHVHP